MSFDQVELKNTNIKIIDGDRGKNYPSQDEYLENGYCLFLSANNVTPDGFRFNKKQFISKEKDESLRKGKLKKGDIILTTRGTVGNVAYYGEEIPFENIRINSGMVLIRTDKDDNFMKRYLYWLFRSKYLQNQIENFSTGTAQPQLPIKIIRRLKIIKTDLKTQKEIVNILSSLDDKIELNKKTNQTLEEMAQAIYKSWFVDFDPFQDKEFIDSELGKIPKNLSIKKLKDFFPVKTGKKNANIEVEKGQYPFFTCAQEVKRADEFSFDSDAILVAGNGDFNVKWYKGKFEAYQRTYVLVPENKELLDFLYYSIDNHLEELTAGHRGSVINYLTKGMIEDFKIIIPKDKKVLYKIAEKFRSINQLIDKNKAENRTLKNLRDTLLPKLMSGEIRVNTDK